MNAISAAKGIGFGYKGMRNGLEGTYECGEGSGSCRLRL